MTIGAAGGRASSRPRSGGSSTVRIIGGQWRRRTLDVVDAAGLRPTPDRVRETLFNWLSHAFGGDLRDRAALDLFAGSGALGYEAASRGAVRVVAVENDGAAFAALQAAKAMLGAGAVELVRGDAFAVAARLQASEARFDVVFLDPPFGRRWLETVLPIAASLCSAGGFVYVEAEEPLIDAALPPLGLAPYRADKAGEVFYHLLRRNK